MLWITNKLQHLKVSKNSMIKYISIQLFSVSFKSEKWKESYKGYFITYLLLM
jgi:hypothetical protein